MDGREEKGKEECWKSVVRCELCGKLITYEFLKKEKYSWEEFVRLISQNKRCYDFCPSCRMITLQTLVGYEAHPEDVELNERVNL